jgi:hypothetical protein
MFDEIQHGTDAAVETTAGIAAGEAKTPAQKFNKASCCIAVWSRLTSVLSSIFYCQK